MKTYYSILESIGYAVMLTAWAWSIACHAI